MPSRFFAVNPPAAIAHPPAVAAPAPVGPPPLSDESTVHSKFTDLSSTVVEEPPEENANSQVHDKGSGGPNNGSETRAMHAATVSIHPLVIAGWCGLTTSAFNMLPVGCLDGGRVMQGAFGKSALAGFSLTTYAMLGLGVLGGPLSLPWGLYVLICQRTLEKPCLNDVTEVGTWRRTVVTVAVFLVVLTLLPIWDELAEELGIGLATTF